jgi:hypothetical protein
MGREKENGRMERKRERERKEEELIFFFCHRE